MKSRCNNELLLLRGGLWPRAPMFTIGLPTNDYTVDCSDNEEHWLSGTSSGEETEPLEEE